MIGKVIPVQDVAVLGGRPKVGVGNRKFDICKQKGLLGMVFFGPNLLAAVGSKEAIHYSLAGHWRYDTATQPPVAQWIMIPNDVIIEFSSLCDKLNPLQGRTKVFGASGFNLKDPDLRAELR